ncbi:NAD(P)-binding protein [Lentithecium fluviatile CBS 122367]|uniref:NAD(P)-binding protein n=1 Tax=Lentithecium fluviatile CBS 122367 TaxID=1168545 RepID=A0A6G1IYQ1_9PLEO|nr:NAD(P)-binding protein [Lentithecium fluviatile CBS 122367]
MAPKIFLTGGTGYIGGSVLHTIVTSHPKYEVTALLRKEPEAFASTYPNVKVIKGDYDSSDIISEEASKADVVVHNGDSDHEPSLKAIIAGLLKRQTSSFLLHLSGTGIVSDWDTPTYLGKLNPKIWSDTTDLAEISSLPDHALHRNTEKILNDTIAQHSDQINIAIMCPPDIYGKGKGLAKTWSAFIPMFVQECKNLEVAGFYYGEGTNTRSWVHIDDLMTVYLKVVEAAAAGGGGFDWGKEGYYFAGTQEVSHIDIARATDAILKKHNFVEGSELAQVSLDQIDTMAAYVPRFPNLGRYLFASNSRTRPHRAEKLWGYKGTAPRLLDVLEEEVLDAVKRVQG